MNDEHVINVLRAAAQRTAYADTDIARAMSCGRRVRRCPCSSAWVQSS